MLEIIRPETHRMQHIRRITAQPASGWAGYNAGL